MQLLIVYVLITVSGELGVVGVGLFLDRAVPSFSLPLSLAMFFSVLGLTWPVAVWITEKWLVRR
jgi:hypothetical protein